MFSIIQRLLKRVKSFDALYDRIDKIEAKLERFEKLADENESLWEFLDEQKEMDEKRENLGWFWYFGKIGEHLLS